MKDGYIKLHRKMLDWEWYQNPNVFRLFVHLLLTANFTDGSFEGEVIKRGQVATSLQKISTGTRLTIQQARTALEHLISTGEITSKQQARYRVITIVNYDRYQTDNRQVNSQITGNQQADNNEITSKLTGNQQQYKKDKNIKKERKEESKETIERGTAQRFTPPTREQIESFCLEHGIQIDADRFIDYYTSNGWMVGRNRMKDWKATVRGWAKRDQQKPAQPAQKVVVAQQYEQRDYSTMQEDILDRQRREFEEMLRRRQG